MCMASALSLKVSPARPFAHCTHQIVWHALWPLLASSVAWRRLLLVVSVPRDQHKATARSHLCQSAARSCQYHQTQTGTTVERSVQLNVSLVSVQEGCGASPYDQSLSCCCRLGRPWHEQTGQSPAIHELALVTKWLNTTE